MSSRRRVCIIFSSSYPYSRGGDELLFTDIAKWIQKQNDWEFVALGRKPRVSRAVSIEKHLPIASVSTLRTSVFGRLFEYVYLSFLDGFFYGKRVSSLRDSFLSNYDVIITPDPLITIHLAKRRSRPRLIQFVGGAWAENAAAVQPLLGPLFRSLEQKAYQLADCLVVMDSIYARQLIQWNKQIKIIPSGVNTTIYDPSRYDRDKLRARFSMTGKRAIITVASLRKAVKGHDFLIRALPQVIKVYPECHLYLAGKGDQEPFRNLARELGIENHIHFLGERLDIPELLAASDVFVLPSLSEGTPRALLEAMAMKLPCIATHVGGIPEIITHQRSGILVKAGVPDAITKAIIHIFSKRKIAKTLGEQARKRIRTNYSMDATANAYIELINRLC